MMDKKVVLLLMLKLLRKTRNVGLFFREYIQEYAIILFRL